MVSPRDRITVTLMKLYLVQHCEPKIVEEDPAKPLSNRGLHTARKMAKYVEQMNVNVKKIVHSGKLRAKQTAEVFAERLNPVETRSDESLEPMAEPKIWVQRLTVEADNIMLVGHLPHLSKLVSMLLTGNGEHSLISFRMGGITCLERGEEGVWNIQWFVVPELTG